VYTCTGDVEVYFGYRRISGVQGNISTVQWYRKSFGVQGYMSSTIIHEYRRNIGVQKK